MMRFVNFLVICSIVGSACGFQEPSHSCGQSFGVSLVSSRLRNALTVVRKQPIRETEVSFTGEGQRSAGSRHSFRLLAATNGEDFHERVPFTHRDIVWKIRPHPEQPWTARAYFLVAAGLLRAYLQILGRKIPSVVCPAGELCQIEAWYEGKQIGRFGITTKPGPSYPIIVQQASKLFPKQRIPDVVQTAAIQYMVVEPDYRKRNIGSLALQVIAHIQAFQNCDFCMLVADDNGSGRLVEWYEQHGFLQAPMLQDFLGSPERRYGVTMMGFTNATIPDGCRIEWW